MEFVSVEYSFKTYTLGFYSFSYELDKYDELNCPFSCLETKHSYAFGRESSYGNIPSIRGIKEIICNFLNTGLQKESSLWLVVPIHRKSIEERGELFAQTPEKAWYDKDCKV